MKGSLLRHSMTKVIYYFYHAEAQICMYFGENKEMDLLQVTHSPFGEKTLIYVDIQMIHMHIIHKLQSLYFSAYGAGKSLAFRG